MKKFLFLMVSVAVAVSASAGVKNAQTEVAKFDRSTTKTEQVVRMAAPGTVSTPYTVAINSLRDDIPEGYCSVTLAAGDVWQDGSGYQMLFDADANTYGTVIPETGGLTSYGNADAATYAEFEYKIPENADGDMATTNIVLNDAVTIFIPAGIYDWCITNPTPGDRIWIASANGSIPGRYDDFEFAAGATYIFTVSLGGSNDRVDLEILDPNAPVVPTNLTADPAATTADVAWENDHDMAFNLRYREYNPNLAQTIVWDFEDEDFTGWQIYDYDGDGYNWFYDNSGYYSHTGNVCLMSASYSGGALTPDNMLISPEVPLNGTLRFWAAPYSSYYPDNFAVYAIVGDEVTDVDNYVKLTEDMAPTEWTEVVVDLSQFEGAMGHFIVRHYNCYDMWRLIVDDFSLEIPGDEPNEWIYVYDLPATNYTIEGLTPETTYEVEVQSVSEDGRTSDWTEHVLFTTLAGGPEPTEKTQTPDGSYAVVSGQHEVVVTITPYEGVVYYRIIFTDPDGNVTESDWMEYVDAFSVYEDGRYRIEFYAVADGKLPSDPGAVEFTVSPMTGIEEMTTGKTVAGVRYFNAVGQEMSQPNGLTIMVTTYTDGTTSAVKVMK